jgi:hypothetical protein
MPAGREGLGELNEVDEYILALLASSHGTPLPGKLHLQKEMFLLQRAFPDLRDQLDFEPYFLGPHSFIVDDEATELAQSEYVQMDDRGLSLAPRGRAIADKVLESLPRERLQRIAEYKDLLNDLPNDELLAFIYFGFPSTEVEHESAEYRRILPRRLDLARALFRKGKVSAERAAEIGGVSLEDFIDSSSAHAR